MKNYFRSLFAATAFVASALHSNATSCDIFQGPICYSIEQAQDLDNYDAFFNVTLNFDAAGGDFIVQPSGVYLGWCLDSSAPIDGSPAQYCDATLLPISGALPSYFSVSTNWNAINYLLNNKGSYNLIQIQEMVWFLFEGRGPSDPQLQVDAEAIAAQHSDFVPVPGQVYGLILNIPNNLDSFGRFIAQPVMIEVTCTGTPPPPPPTQEEICLETATPDASVGGTGTPAVLDFGTGTKYVTGLIPLRLVPTGDTTASITGVVYQASNPTLAFNLNFQLTGFTNNGTPVQLLNGSTYVTNSPLDWVYYTGLSGTLTGISGFTGMNVVVSSTNGVQVGLSANNKNAALGLYSTFSWLITSGSSAGCTGNGLLTAESTECIEINEECLIEAKAIGASKGHAFYLPGIGTDFVAGSTPLHFVQVSNGSGYITGVVYSASSPNKRFSVSISVSGFTDDAPAGSPKKELPTSAYSENGGPINTSNWVYYTGFTGTLTGLGDYAGAVLTINRTGPAFQAGVGANGKNYNDGASAWFTVTVTKQPSNYCFRLCPTSHGDINLDFGPCVPEPTECIGTGTPGYWKNHAAAWPVESIVIGGKTYTKSQAISLMGQSPSGDNTYTMFRHLVSAKLNVLIGNVSGCISNTIASADYWLRCYPLGSCVSGSSQAWCTGAPLATKLDDYNNGRLCAPHRDTLDCTTDPEPPVCDPTPKPCPSPWKDKNLGNCNYGGSSSHNNGCYTVKGSGCDIWGNKDDCKYVFQNAYGDCEIIAKVSSLDNTDAWAKAGVMIRESMNSDSKHAFACVTPGNGMAFQRRCNTGGSSEHTPGGSGYSWVKLKRVGSTFTCYKSKDGYNWTKVSECRISMSSNCYIGFAVTSHNNSKTCEAKFTNVKIVQ